MHEKIRRHLTPPRVMQEHHGLGNRMIVILSLALSLFSAMGLLAAETGAYASAPAPLSARPSSEGPWKRHTPTPLPTLTMVPTLTALPSPTASATSAPPPSPTFVATPTIIATTTVQATAPVKATVPSMTGEVGGNPVLTPGTDPPSRSDGSSPVSSGKAGILFPLTLSFAICILLVAVGLALRTSLLPAGKRITLLPARKKKLPPSGAAPWQRVRPADLDDSVGDDDAAGKPAAMTTALPHPLDKNISSRTRALLTLTGHRVPKRRSAVQVRHFLRPTRLNALSTGNRSPATEQPLSPLPEQKTRRGVTIRERARERQRANAQKIIER